MPLNQRKYTRKVTKKNYLEKFLPHDKSSDGKKNSKVVNEIIEKSNNFVKIIESIKNDFF